MQAQKTDKSHHVSQIKLPTASEALTVRPEDLFMHRM